jgi:hypothetical protein
VLLFPFYETNIADMQIAQVIHAMVAVLFVALIDALQAADQEDSALQQAHRASRHLGRAKVAGGGEYRAKSAEGKVAAPSV